jgi:hypothetical protein
MGIDKKPLVIAEPKYLVDIKSSIMTPTELSPTVGFTFKVPEL